MNDSQQLKTVIERTKKALTLKPSLGKGTGLSKVRITDGLRCEIEEGNWKLQADMPPAAGGEGSAPTPGVYGRAALGACLAIGYMMKAAELAVVIKHLEVAIEADFDDGALFGTADKSVPAGYLEVRYTVHVESDEPQEQIMQVINEGDAHSPYLDIFTREQTCVRTVHISSPKTLS
ncbi:OsmC family protein [Spirosoma litoris]